MNETDLFRAAFQHLIEKEGHGGQTKIAAIAGITTVYLNGILRGHKPGSEDARGKISAALGKTYADMLILGEQLLTGVLPEGNGGDLVKGAETIALEEFPSEQINLSEGRLMAEMVLVSNTRYAGALWANLKSFAEAVRKEAQVKELEKRVEDGFRESRSEIAELKEMIKALGGDLPVKKSQAA